MLVAVNKHTHTHTHTLKLSQSLHWEKRQKSHDRVWNQKHTYKHMLQKICSSHSSGQRLPVHTCVFAVTHTDGWSVNQNSTTNHTWDLLNNLIWPPAFLSFSRRSPDSRLFPPLREPHWHTHTHTHTRSAYQRDDREGQELLWRGV